MFSRGLLLPILLLALWPAPCVAGVAPVIPEQLKPWTEWVLFDYEEQQRCTPSYADASSLQTTTIPFLRRVIEHPDFAAGRVDTKFLERTPELFLAD